MEKEFVTYELALRMKALGFDKPCFGYYSNGELVYSTHTNNTMQRFRYSAPTWQSAFAWFRENYSLNSWVYPVLFEKNGVEQEIVPEEYSYQIVFIGITQFVSTTNDYNYKQAQQACLEQLCEIVERKKEDKWETLRGAMLSVPLIDWNGQKKK